MLGDIAATRRSGIRRLGGIEDAGASAVDIEAGFGCCGLRCCKSLVPRAASSSAATSGTRVMWRTETRDDDVRFSVHEAACFEGFGL